LALVALKGFSERVTLTHPELHQVGGEIGTIGTFPKGGFRKNNRLYLLKGEKPKGDQTVAAEIAASEIGRALGLNVWKYTFDISQGIPTASCEMMSDDDIDIVMADDFRFKKKMERSAKITEGTLFNTSDKIMHE